MPGESANISSGKRLKSRLEKVKTAPGKRLKKPLKILEISLKNRLHLQAVCVIFTLLWHDSDEA